MIEERTINEIIMELEQKATLLSGSTDLHEARFKIFEAINILKRYRDNQKLVVRNRPGGYCPTTTSGRMY